MKIHYRRHTMSKAVFTIKCKAKLTVVIGKDSTYEVEFPFGTGTDIKDLPDNPRFLEILKDKIRESAKFFMLDVQKDVETTLSGE
jgi:hypothetical protein